MADPSTVAALKATDLFGSLGNRALGRIADATRIVEHSAGKTIAAEGEDGIGLHLITAGTATVTVHGTTRPGLAVGDYFGEVSLIDGLPRSATVVADTPLTTLSIAAWQFQPVLESEPEVARALLLTLCGRLRRAESS